MRIIFVGLHNKPGMKPLDIRTKSGKLIERIAEPLRRLGHEVLLTNLFDVDRMPTKDEMEEMIFDWIERVELFQNDKIVLLGQTVHKNFPPLKIWTPVKIAHPASKKSHEQMNEYVAKSLELLLR